MRIFYKLLIIILTANNYSTSSQPFNYYQGKEANNWYFGEGAGITFTTEDGHPVALLDCNKEFWASENAASISDINGKLEYYSWAASVYGSNHKKIEEFGGIFDGLFTTNNITQGIGIIKFENNPKHYFLSIWTNNKYAKAGKFKGKEAAGCGFYADIPSILLTTIGNNKYFSIDTIESTHHITEGMSTYFNKASNTYSIANLLYDKYIIINKLNSDGRMDSSQIIDYKRRSKYNCIKYSPDGKYLAISHFEEYRVLLCKKNTNGIFEIDRIISTDYENTSIEFSPNGRYLYIAHINIDGVNQYDIEKNETIKLPSSNTWGMQLGPDGRVYCLDYHVKNVVPHVSHIKYPNRKGLAAMYENAAVDLKGKYATFGFPNYPSNLFYYTNGAVEILAKDTVCQGESFTLTPLFNEKGMAIDSIEWVGPKGLISRKDTVLTIDRMTKIDKGRYTFYVYVGDERFRAYHDVLLVADSLDISITYKDKLEFCEGDTITLSADKDYHRYEWSNGKTTKSIQVTEAGWYYLKAYNSVGCDDIDSIEVKVFPLPEIAFDVPSVLCQGTEIELKTKHQFAKYKWSTGDSTSSIIVSNSGTYSLEVENEIGCQTSKEIVLNFAPKIELQILGNSTFCTGGFVKIKTNLNSTDYDFEWSNGETTNEISISIGGTYTVKATNKKTLCTATASIEIKEINSEFAQIEGTLGLCENSKTTLTAKPDNMTYLWSNGAINQSISVNTAATYWVLVSSPEACSDTAFVEITNSKIEIPTLTYQAKICKDTETVISVKQDYESYLWNTGETTKSIKAKAGKYSVSVRNADNCEATTEIEITHYEPKISFNRNKIDFSEVALNQSKTETLTITEMTDIEEFTASSILFQVNKNNDKIEITFTPNEAKIYEDSLIIEVQKPCYARYAIFIKGVGIDYSLPIIVSAPHLEYTPGENISIPIKLEYKGDSKYLPINTNYEIEVEIAKDAIIIDETHTMSNNKRKVVFAGNLDIASNELIIEQITGLSLLAENEINSIEISKISFSDSKILAEKADGSLKMVGVCSPYLRNITAGTAIFSQIKPNPATNEAELEIHSNHQGMIDIIIYNYDGLEVYRNSINKTESIQNTKLNLQNISSGKYFYSIKQGKESISSGSLIIEK